MGHGQGCWWGSECVRGLHFFDLVSSGLLMSFCGSQGYQTLTSLEWRVLHQFVGGLSFTEELKDIVLCIPWGGTRTLPQGCSIVSWLLLPYLLIPSLPWLATVWICPLELREGQGGWSLFPTNKKQETQKGFRAQEGHKVLLGFILHYEPKH